MEFETFKKTVRDIEPPEGITIYLLAMWHDKRNNWSEAHSIVDGLKDSTACWVHAYLHRREGDSWNADYWYRQAGRMRPDVSLEQEWETIVKALL